MPIICPVRIAPIGQDRFGRIDYDVMRLAFESQNTLGRLCDEVIYQNDLAARIESAGFGPVRKEVPVTVEYHDFVKTYSLDLLVADSAIYELKTASTLVAEHEAQLLNYLCLYGVRHGKLINFRPDKIQSRFVNTTLSAVERLRFTVNTENWREDDEHSRLLRETLSCTTGEHFLNCLFILKHLSIS